VLDTLGWILAGAKQTDHALDVLGKAASVAPDQVGAVDAARDAPPACCREAARRVAQQRPGQAEPPRYVGRRLRGAGARARGPRDRCLDHGDRAHDGLGVAHRRPAERADRQVARDHQVHGFGRRADGVRPQPLLAGVMVRFGLGWRHGGPEVARANHSSLYEPWSSADHRRAEPGRQGRTFLTG